MNRARRGKSLIEVMVVMSLAGVVLFMSGRTILLLMEAQRGSEKGTTTTLTLSRLAHTFRRDVHAAVSFEKEQKPDETGDRLKLQLPGDELVVYETAADGMHRRTFDGAKVRSHESFLLPAGTNRIEIVRETPLAALVYIPHKPFETAAELAANANARAYRIEAVPGRDHRFSTKDAEKKVSQHETVPSQGGREFFSGSSSHPAVYEPSCLKKTPDPFAHINQTSPIRGLPPKYPFSEQVAEVRMRGGQL